MALLEPRRSHYGYSEMGRSKTRLLPRLMPRSDVASSVGEGASTLSRARPVAAGRDEAIARGTEHHIHGLDGQVHEKNSYGNDPRNIPS